MSILKELGLVGNIPVNIERLIRGQGIKLKTEDFTPNKKILNTMNKEILQQVLLEIINNLWLKDSVAEVDRPHNPNTNEKQRLRCFNKRLKDVRKKYDAIEDLIKQI